MGACARALANFAILRQIEIHITRVPGESLTLADALSRRSRDKNMDYKGMSIIEELRLSEVPIKTFDRLIDVEL